MSQGRPCCLSLSRSAGKSARPLILSFSRCRNHCSCSGCGCCACPFGGSAPDRRAQSVRSASPKRFQRGTQPAAPVRRHPPGFLWPISAKENRGRAWASVVKGHLGFGLVWATCCALLFFYGIGRDRYQVRSDVVVRKAAQDSAAAGLSLGNLLGGGNQGSLEDSRYLRTYLESPQVLEDLENQFNFRQAYAQKGLDPFAGLWLALAEKTCIAYFASRY